MSEQTQTPPVSSSNVEPSETSTRGASLASAFAPSKTLRREGRGGGLSGLVRPTARPTSPEPATPPEPPTEPTSPLAEEAEPVTPTSDVSIPAPDPVDQPVQDEQPRRARPQNQPRPARQTTPQPKPSRAAAARPSATTVVIRLTPTARDHLAHARGRTAKTNTELVLLALENQHPHLPELIRAQAAPVVRGVLFMIAATPQRQIRVQVSLRLTADQVHVIDELVSQHDAFDRGELIEAAVNAEYGTPR